MVAKLQGKPHLSECFVKTESAKIFIRFITVWVSSVDAQGCQVIFPGEARNKRLTQTKEKYLIFTMVSNFLLMVNIKSIYIYTH